MLKIALTLLVVLISVYWVGEKARKNPKIDVFLSEIEGQYSKLNGKLEEATIRNGLLFLRQLYGWISIFLFLCLFAVQRLPQPNYTAFIPLFWSFGFTFMGWFSIKWVTDHKNTIAEFSRNNALLIFGPLLLGVFDFVFHTPFTEMLILPFHQIETTFHFNLPQISNPLAIGALLSLIFLAVFFFYYLLTWTLTGPIFLISVFSVLIPINFARLLAKIDRNNTFFWLTAFIMIVIL